ncbi:xanthine dehydrogenase accessory protein XdhC [Rhodobacter capsulatus]|uniref:Xanthine dehydrogenase accessory protein XdhC n=1 Tax=Rhodobacter capsulatus TaxID=1061 RepID=A0A4U1JPU7_RHOCA|nr:xanthine dehydrogenase accessory protein XdhC [Rhodobacter capsulatus]TKD18026.1 xanthine dehydrogenase accessory protein XdhC [Rhodobacter capsulatus]
MSLHLQALAQAAAKGPFVRVLVVETRGSTPREVGAEMLVWHDHTQGTIGGGTLEAEATAIARGLRAPALRRFPLGPALGQCCGGAVTLAFEPLDAESLARITGPIHARPLTGSEMPLSVQRALSRARNSGEAPPRLLDGWLIEPLAPPAQELWIWGAGHVGRALVATLAPLPHWSIRWADFDRSRFPATIPEAVTPVIAENPADLVPLAAASAHHLILTYSHALDLELCHRVLRHGFAACGVIGSATKWSRFQHRLRDLGHDHAQISRIACPIGDPALGKEPQAIAISVAAALLRERVSRALLAVNTEGQTG